MRRRHAFTLVELPAVSPRKRAAFTLVELLVVIGIIALLISILLPALGRARAQANDIKCASNIRQLVTSLTMYATQNKGKFPPNLNTGAMYPTPAASLPQANLWYDQDRIGKFLPNTVTYGSGSIGGNIFVCPNDDDAARSYAMNIWASCVADQFVLDTASNGFVYKPPGSLGSTDRGTMFASNTKGGSQLILITEKFSANASQGFYAAGSSVGYQGTTAGIRFTGDLAISTPRFGVTPTEIDWARHRRKDDRGNGTEAKGRVNIGFCDGHVEMLKSADLADPVTKKSKMIALWSPFDRTAP